MLYSINVKPYNERKDTDFFFVNFTEIVTYKINGMNPS